MHEIPSSHVSDVHRSLSYEPQEIIHRPEHPAFPIVVFERSNHQPLPTDSPLQVGTHLRANIDGRSVHDVTVDPDTHTLITDQDERFAMPKPGDTSPISSIAEVTVTPLPNGGIQKDIRLLYVRPPK